VLAGSKSWLRVMLSYLDIKVFPDTTEYAQNVLQMLLKMSYIFYLNAQNTMKTENHILTYINIFSLLSENWLICFFHSVINNDFKKMLTLFLNFPSVFFRRLISVFVVLNMFIMILIDPYHDGFLERYNSLVSLYASFNNGNYDYTNPCNNLWFITEWKKQINQFSDSKLKILIYVRIILS
jgi:hypothetical protein